ncbi:hypothetical protein [Delftia acidovorans]|uniref:hypothetical protein n=1 Tax=Delftia acidovorans TaxID=80866 RepID=UPI000F816134|nr:hypothetical protein [Delftia acidovorans]
MNATAKRRARANPAASAENNEALQQMVRLSITRAENELRRLVAARCDDAEWNDVDVNVDLAMELALSHVRRMKGVTFDGYSAFQEQWFLASAAVSLGRQTFSRPASFYGRMLAGVEAMFEQAVEFVEYAAHSPAEVVAPA